MKNYITNYTMFEKKLDILGCLVNKTNYKELLLLIEEYRKINKQITITGVNVNTINQSINNTEFRNNLSKITVLHPDGVGVYLASKLLYGRNGFLERINGSDFYSELIPYSIKHKLSFYFFGDLDKTLSRIQQTTKGITVKGFHNGFEYNNEKLIEEINSLNPDILIVGLGSPKQEEWVVKNQNKIKINIIIAVGEGIRVFAGTKRRGFKVVRILGFEWFVRLLNEPLRLWKRYLIGNPLFILRILIVKLLHN